MSNVDNGASRRLSCLRGLSAIFTLSLLTCLTFGPAQPAFAQNDDTADAPETTAAMPKKETKPDGFGPGPYFAVVSIADQRISVYGSTGLVARSTVSTGMRGYGTPTGVFSIVQKKRYHESNIYSGAPMPFMQRITWSGIALHAGVVPGYPASHGCIRLPGGFAPRLFSATEVGQRVIVAPHDITPFELRHPTLPAPKMQPAPKVAMRTGPDSIFTVNSARQNGGAILEPTGFREGPVEPQQLNPLEFARMMKDEATAKAKVAAQDTRAAVLLLATKTTEQRVSGRKLAIAEDVAREAARDLAAAIRKLEKTDGKQAIADAIEGVGEASAAITEAEKSRDARIAAATEAQKQAEAAMSEAQGAADDARIAQANENKTEADAALAATLKVKEARLAKAMVAKGKADAALAEAQKVGELRVAKAIAAKADAEAHVVETQKDEEQRIVAATEAKAEAERALAEAQKLAAEARAINEAKLQELTAARNATLEAKATSKAAADSLTEATRRMKPLSVFISRKTGRLYVRQAFLQLFDVPVAIRDPEREIGTHVYVSTRASDDGSQLSWQVVSMPAQPETRPVAREGKRNKNEASIAAAMVPLVTPETAKGALDRITVSDDVAQRLAELTWVGATVIVSDNAMSGETGSPQSATTDFVILTRRASGR
ncbi:MULTISPECIES: L,D-transpeptidase family protein [Rhodomicrobium]|uniref:L,D-transpeptidase family protein n=1 Tax=Rhodomicrobium TaxID=1068 RepID=UPI001FD8AC82|nr:MULTISPECIES: L,D-transpeptidase family protein [Rhodomicrobium]